MLTCAQTECLAQYVEAEVGLSVRDILKQIADCGQIGCENEFG